MSCGWVLFPQLSSAGEEHQKLVTTTSLIAKFWQLPPHSALVEKLPSFIDYAPPVRYLRQPETYTTVTYTTKTEVSTPLAHKKALHVLQVTCTIQKPEAIFKKCMLSPTPLLSSHAITNTRIYENQVTRSQEENWKPRLNSFQRFLHILVFFSYEQMEIPGTQS